MKKTVVLGITGGIAAVKVLDLIDTFSKKNINIEVTLSSAAENIVDIAKIEKKLNKKVYTSLFSKEINIQQILKKRQVEHIDLAGRAAAIVIAPATANVIAKLATGIADDYLTTVILAATCPIIVCPSMNVHMWHHPATQRNVQMLRSLGYIIVEPDSGMLACGYEGQGRLAALHIIVKQTTEILDRSQILQGKKVIVTSGGTKMPIDDVRYISNRSSGKMGVALAEGLFLRGADVLIVRSKDSVKPRYNMPEKIFETAEDLAIILENEVKHSEYIFHVAAVSDFFLEKKHGKFSSSKPLTLTLIPQEKIIDQIKTWNAHIKLIAFKAESNSSEKNLINRSKGKLIESNADFVIANDIGKKDRGFEVDTNEVFVLSKDKQPVKIPLVSKKEIAEKILDIVVS